MKARCRLYLAKDGWRWQTKSLNGKVTGASSEGYVNRSEAVTNMLRQAKVLEEGAPPPKPGVRIYEWTVEV